MSGCINSIKDRKGRKSPSRDYQTDPQQSLRKTEECTASPEAVDGQRVCSGPGTVPLCKWYITEVGGVRPLVLFPQRCHIFDRGRWQVPVGRGERKSMWGRRRGGRHRAEVMIRD